MAELLKNLYSKEYVELLALAMAKVLSPFDKNKFVSEILDSEWEARELKQRTSHISAIFGGYLSVDYSESIDQMFAIIEQLKNEGVEIERLTSLFLPDYVEKNGVDYFETSVKAIERLTQFISCEFAVRPFILKYQQDMYDRMLEWTTHSSEHVRRLASEGSRPMLPWGMAFPELKKDPSPILPILEALKSDSSEYVRKSVANSLNDISKNHPDLVISISKQWLGKSKDTDWIIKHACRSLLKEGRSEVMQLFGFGGVDEIRVDQMSLESENIKVGEELRFAFDLHNIASSKKKLRLEYGLYYQKQNGTLSRKVFKISEKQYDANSTTRVSKHQSFRLISTRKFHPGKHKVSIIVNGMEFTEMEFNLSL